jgi:hypothetical protein
MKQMVKHETINSALNNINVKNGAPFSWWCVKGSSGFEKCGGGETIGYDLRTNSTRDPGFRSTTTSYEGFCYQPQPSLSENSNPVWHHDMKSSE